MLCSGACVSLSLAPFSSHYVCFHAQAARPYVQPVCTVNHTIHSHTINATSVSLCRRIVGCGRSHKIVLIREGVGRRQRKQPLHAEHLPLPVPPQPLACRTSHVAHMTCPSMAVCTIHLYHRPLACVALHRRDHAAIDCAGSINNQYVNMPT
jgi:hypothetical protein